MLNVTVDQFTVKMLNAGMENTALKLTLLYAATPGSAAKPGTRCHTTLLEHKQCLNVEVGSKVSASW